ncbi:MAG: DUF6691 family protein [Erythrobacter sp.]
MIRRHLPPLLSGLLFGAGLALGGMTDPARVRGFLDIFGAWDPTLAFVMGAALAVMTVAWRFVPRMRHPLFAEKFALPDRNDLTGRLVGGSMLFGLGWGIAGLCPGPGFAALAIAPLEAAVFTVSMVSGMVLQRLFFERGARASPS